jgi:adenylosuccinate lyase
MNHPICPLDFRYGRKEIKEIFSEEHKLGLMLKVEAALAQAHAEVGNIPRPDADEIVDKASLKFIRLARVKEIEKEIKHDVGAIVQALGEVCSPSARRWVHFGATSYDIVDSANALQLVEASKLIKANLRSLIEAIAKLAERHKATLMIGRTHGQHALPITFGLKLACWVSELTRQYLRFADAEKQISVGKMLGAVGSGAGLGQHAFEIQDKVMKALRLSPELGSTQIIGRDRYIAFISVCANLAASMEKIAQEIRTLQRTEIMEVSEGFSSKQIGSSAMPQKKNPITCEQVCGLARIVRAHLLPAWENALQWDERDLANSSGERFLLGHTCVLLDWIIYKLKNVMDNLLVFPDRMLQNLELSLGVSLAESLMNSLLEKGMEREKAYRMVQAACKLAQKERRHLGQVAEQDKEFLKYLSPEEIAEALNPRNYLGKSEEIVDLILKKCRQKLKD